MSSELDLDDVIAGHVVAQRAVAELRCRNQKLVEAVAAARQYVADHRPDDLDGAVEAEWGETWAKLAVAEVLSAYPQREPAYQLLERVYEYLESGKAIQPGSCAHLEIRTFLGRDHNEEE